MKLIIIVSAITLSVVTISVYASVPTPQSNIQAYNACEKFVEPLSAACIAK